MTGLVATRGGHLQVLVPRGIFSALRTGQVCRLQAPGVRVTRQFGSR